ncbi:MAG TPA: hypothetical protein PLD47_08945 [Aggregatilineales bacterium]|nr:hypothetical protein [Aggregatilineales bacterium]
MPHPDTLTEMLRHLPPSGERLHLIHLGDADSAAFFSQSRPDLHITQTPPLLTFEPTSADALIAFNRADTLTADNPPFLAQTRTVLRPGGRLILLDQDREDHFTRIVGVLEEAGFVRVLAERLPKGAGILARGEVPYPNLTTLERIALSAERGGEALPNRQREYLYLFLLIRQTSNKAAWALTPADTLRWEAITAADGGGAAVLLTFTSLPKAVQFMQAAVKAGAIRDVNKIAKFSSEVAAVWTLPHMVNPTFEVARYAFTAPYGIDPASAISGEE